MKALLRFAPISVFIALAINSCRHKEVQAKFDLNKATIVEKFRAMDGEIVDMVGDPGPYREAYAAYGNYGESGGGSDGTSRAGHKLEYQHEVDFYHVIHVYDNEAGGAFLVGRRIPAPIKK